MIGTLPLWGDTEATLNEDGWWSHEDDELEDFLNDLFPVDPGEVGDHHRPYGVAALGRAAEWAGRIPDILVPLPQREPPAGVLI